MKRLPYAWIFIFYATYFPSGAEGATEKPNFQAAPLLQYDLVNLESQTIRSSSTGVAIKNGETSFVGLYSRRSFHEPLLLNYPDFYHSIDMLLDTKSNDYQFLAIFKSESDQPVKGGLSTYQAGAAWGYDLVRESNFSFVLGGGVAVGDFGIETKDGRPWPIIPIPLMRINYKSSFINYKFEMLTSPNISFTLLPKNRLHLVGDLRIDNARDMRDVIFELKLDYRLFSQNSPYGDFAGCMIGIKNDSYGEFNLGNSDGQESLEFHESFRSACLASEHFLPYNPHSLYLGIFTPIPSTLSH